MHTKSQQPQIPTSAGQRDSAGQHTTRHINTHTNQNKSETLLKTYPAVKSHCTCTQLTWLVAHTKSQQPEIATTAQHQKLATHSNQVVTRGTRFHSHMGQIQKKAYPSAKNHGSTSHLSCNTMTAPLNSNSSIIPKVGYSQ